MCGPSYTVGFVQMGQAHGTSVSKLDPLASLLCWGVAATWTLTLTIYLRPPYIHDHIRSGFLLCVIVVGCRHTTNYDGVSRREPHGLRPRPSGLHPLGSVGIQPTARVLFRPMVYYKSRINDLPKHVAWQIAVVGHPNDRDVPKLPPSTRQDGALWHPSTRSLLALS